MSRHPSRRVDRKQADRGVALVEFAFVMVLFFTLIFGIVNFGVLLAFKQNMTQSASEAARAAIAVTDDPATVGVDERKEVAISSMQASLTDFNQQCTQSGGTASCLVKIHECDPPVSDFAAIVDPTISSPATEPTDPCLTTYIRLDNNGAGRILPPFPIISSFEPNTLTSQTTVRLVPVSI